MPSTEQAITSRLTGVLFGFYSSQEARDLSVCEIKNIIAFDNFGRAVEGGLYDEKMGVSPYEKNTKCVTCGQEEHDCPGHQGHIELTMPVYNCFLMNYLHKVLRIKCWGCHKIKFPKHRLREYKILFTLIKLGLYEEFERFKVLCESKISLRKSKLGGNAKNLKAKTSVKKEGTNRKDSKSTRRPSESSGGDHVSEEAFNQEIEKEKNRSKILEELYSNVEENIEKEKEAIIDLLNIPEHAELFERGICSTFSTNKAFSDLLKEFMREAATVNKCPHCNSVQPSLRKEGHAKFVLGGLNEKTRIGRVLFAGDVGESDSEITKSVANDSDDEALKLDDASVSSKSEDGAKKKGRAKLLHVLEVREQTRLLFDTNSNLMNLLFGNLICNKFTLKNSPLGFEILKFSPDNFFLEVLPISPNRFRPENKLSESTYLHPHTTILQKILTINYELKSMLIRAEDPSVQLPQTKNNQKIVFGINNKEIGLKETFAKWIEMQEAVNSLYDSSKTGKLNTDGETCIKQLLEKKEGIFRMKIMGKRVNYAARSVISPDPMLDTNEVGVPMFMAKKLTFPEGVNEANCEKLKQLVKNGPSVWPGALYVSENGQKISLEGSTVEQREAIAKTLLENAENKVVYRQLQNGDVLLFNRQPTLHKPSLMSHIARVLPSNQTIRMHYANCSSYNADFDGDEMNLHFLQNHLARAEAYNISLTDYQYILPTNKSPIRGMIQDIILSAVFLTMQGTFFEKSEVNQLIYSSLRTLIENDTHMKRISLVKPAILKPRKLWTGKQVVSSIIRIIAERDEVDQQKLTKFLKTYDQQGEDSGKNAEASIKTESLYMSCKTTVNESYLSDINNKDKQVIVQGNDLVTGILDKNNIGAKSFGLLHCFYELTDAKRTGRLMSALSRLFCNFLQMHGFTCGLEDLITTPEFEEFRRSMVDETFKSSIEHLAKKLHVEDFVYDKKWDMFNRSAYSLSPEERLKKILKKKPMKDYLPKDNQLSWAIGRKVVCNESGIAEIDSIVIPSVSKQTSEINKEAMTNGLKKKFPENNFSIMVLTGAKGSTLNHNQISCMLGQQVLEGARVPIMASGRSLPSFTPYSPNLRAGGFVGDRFLTGLRPQEFFFHCMAGREGLVDTAVKTSRSGYLQRILVKNLESLIVQYDYTVRENDGTIVQFLYGEDGLDTHKVNQVENVAFMADNFESFKAHSSTDIIKKSIDSKSAIKWWKKQEENAEEYKFRVVTNELNPAMNFGSISMKAQESLRQFTSKDPRFATSEAKKSRKEFEELFYSKYYTSLACPGEAVGAIAAQGFGEPSTQMTLNTFHTSGSGANMTLGIPRLKELLVTRATKTPSMTLKFKKATNQSQAKRFARSIQKVTLHELIQKIEVEENKILLDKNNRALNSELRQRSYRAKLTFENLSAIKFAFGLTKGDLEYILEKVFKTRLIKSIQKILLKRHHIKNTNPSDELGDLDVQNGILNFDLENIRLKRLAESKTNEDGDSPVIAIQSEYDEDEQEDADDGIEDILYKKTDEMDLEDKDELEATEVEGENQKLVSKTGGKRKSKTSKKIVPALSEKENETSTVSGFVFNHNECQFSVNLPLDSEKLLMLNILEDISKLVTVREIPGITHAHALPTKENKSEYYIFTEGVNFHQIANFEDLDINKLYCNDPHSIAQFYGIEAARSSLVTEVDNVFSHYGIAVNHRHLFLVADFMTNHGFINPMSRAGMQYNTSSLVKMSFETTMKFMTDACLGISGGVSWDKGDTPSGRLVLGRNVKNGTGCFDIKHDFGFEIEEKDSEDEKD